ncbi:hypothetical protein JW926_18865 [Candidatus Sumerlaeota bacterium]|nr:hypothetical protein [Candidatus Sumerlaeota bacterium]
MRKIIQYFSMFLFMVMFLNPVFAETVLRWKGKAYDFEGASITAGLNQAGEKAPSDIMGQMAFKTIVQTLCSDFKKDLYQCEGKKVSEAEFAAEKYPSIRKAHDEAALRFKSKVEIYKIYTDEKTKSNPSPEDFYKQRSANADFIKCFPKLDNWKRFLMTFPSLQMAERELEFYTIDQDTALKIYLDLTGGKLMKQEWIVRKVRITNPELLARTFPEDPEFTLKNNKRQDAASKGPKSSSPRPKVPIFLFLEESEVMRSIYSDLEFESDRWKDVFEKEMTKLFDNPLYK